MLIGSGVLGAVLLLVIGVVLQTNTKFDRFFGSPTLRDYVRPFYGDITACTGTTVQLATGATCTFKTGERVQLIELDAGITLAAWRSALEQAPGVDNVDQGRWRNGDVWTLDTDGDPSLYWDVEDARIAGLAVLASGDETELRSWWGDHFGR